MQQICVLEASKNFLTKNYEIIDNPMGKNAHMQINEDPSKEVGNKLYRSLVMRFMYINVCTRHEISFSIIILAIFDSKPSRYPLISETGIL